MNRTTFFCLWLLCTLVYLLGLPVEIMDVDSAQYAVISRQMVETGEFLEVYLGGRDYLDKPPLLFWVNALFFKIFGYANWSFKLGSFLATLLAVYSTFRLGKLLYNAAIGRLAAIVLYSCQAFFLFNNDVRTDTLLTAACIFAIWQWAAWLQRPRWFYLAGLSAGLAAAMLTKGPIGLMVPLLAIGMYLLGQDRLRDLFRWQYLLVLLAVGILLSPMLWGLYTQFDSQPEKTVLMPTSSGMKYEQGISGLRFYFWSQSFGRITGESDWSDATGPLFFVHNLLWSFLPWAVLFIIALVGRFAGIFRRLTRQQPLPELMTSLGFILPFIAFSMSSYKLPHYIFVLFPLASILTAQGWTQRMQEGKLAWRYIGFVAQFLVWLVSGAVLYYIFFVFFPGAPLWIVISALILLVMAGVLLLRGWRQMRYLFLASVLISVAVNAGLNAWFYPRLMEYQVGENFRQVLEEKNISPAQVYPYHFHSFSLHYYLEYDHYPVVNDAYIRQELARGEPVYLLTPESYFRDVADDFNIAVVHQTGRYPVTQLRLPFLNPETRNATLEQMFLVQVLNNYQEE